MIFVCGKFSDYFCEYKPKFDIKNKLKQSVVKVVSFGEFGRSNGKLENVTVSDYCKIDGQNIGHLSISVIPTQMTIDAIQREICVYDAGGVYFNIIVNDRGRANLHWKYNSILGGRFLGEISDFKDILDNIKNES
jgi:hypothetical protein